MRGLTVQERAEHIAERVRLTGEKAAKNPAAQVAPSENQVGYKRPPPQKLGGINAAVRELGVDRSEAQRAAKIAGLSDEAKQAAARQTEGDPSRNRPRTSVQI